MGITSNPQTWSRRIDLFSKEAIVRCQKVLREAVIAGHKAATEATPVDFSFAKANWVPSIGDQPNVGALKPFNVGVDERTGRFGNSFSASESIGATLGKAGQWDAGRGTSFWLTNVVQYIIPLHEGHSSQAVAGIMTATAIAAIRTVVKRGLK